MFGLRPHVCVVNCTEYPDAEVAGIVERAMVGSRRHPPTVLVRRRIRRADDREGFTPFDHSQPIDLWIEAANRYPQPGARCWQEELALSAMHEDYHFRHPNQPCPNNRCEREAEAYAQALYRRRGL